MNRYTKTLLAVLAASAIFAGSANATTIYTWTGADFANDGTWQNDLNWSGGVAPDGVTDQLSTDTATDVVIFDSETAVGGNLPSNAILTRNSFTGSFKNPQIDLRNGTLNFVTNSFDNWGWSGITTMIVGDGNLTTSAIANLGYRNLNRDPNGIKTYVVNSDGTLNVVGQITAFSFDGAKDTVIQLNGGSFTVGGLINSNLTNDPGDFISFNAVGSTFTADFGGQFADLATVIGQFGDSLVDNSGSGLLATDNGDGSFTVSVIPEPASLVLLGMGSLLIASRRRQRG